MARITAAVLVAAARSMNPYPEGTVLAGKLRIVRLLGAGGMGAVYEVEHTITKHRRALKMLHADMARIPSLVARFLREASAAGHIGNPHIVETFDAGYLDSGEPYIVMELLKGTPLSDLLEQRGKLSVEETIEIVEQACEGVQAAHDKGIVHRDLKPDNIFISEGDSPFVKIVDFGISKFDPELTGNNAITVEGTALGTPYYMPPEQVRGEKDITPQADVYAMGVVLYECLTGAKPFYAETLPHLSLLINEGKYTPVPELRPDVPPELGAVVSRAMHVDRGRRFRSMTELAGSLHNLEAPQSLLFGDTLAAGSVGTRPGHALPASGAPLQPSPAPASAAPSPQPSGVAAQSGIASGGEASQIPQTTGEAGALTREPPSAAPAGGNRTLLVAAGVVLVVAVIGIAAFAMRSSGQAEQAADLQAEPSATPGAQGTPGVAPVRIEPSEPVPPEPSAVPPPSATAAKPPSAPKPPAAPAPAPTGGTRAGEHGLAEENPF